MSCKEHRNASALCNIEKFFMNTLETVDMNNVRAENLNTRLISVGIIT